MTRIGACKKGPIVEEFYSDVQVPDANMQPAPGHGGSTHGDRATAQCRKHLTGSVSQLTGAGFNRPDLLPVCTAQPQTACLTPGEKGVPAVACPSPPLCMMSPPHLQLSGLESGKLCASSHASDL